METISEPSIYDVLVRREQEETPGTLSNPKSGGGKLCRTETVTVRLDPKLSYLCELAARKQRRTKSSFIEWAVDRAISSITLHGDGKTFDHLAASLWHIDPAERLKRLHRVLPELLTYGEEIALKGSGLDVPF